MSKKRASAVEFVMIWQASKSTKEVAEKLGLSCNAAYNRAGRMCQRGVKLKRLTNSPRFDVKSLNKLIKEMDK